jgi:hypothetical protein
MCRILQAVTYMNVVILSCIPLTRHAYILGFLAFAQTPTILLATNDVSLFLGVFHSREMRPLPLPSLSVRLSTRISAASTYRNFVKFYIGDICIWKFVQKVQIWLISEKNIEHFTWRLRYVLMFPATLHRQTVLCSTQMVPGCSSVRLSL